MADGATGGSIQVRPRESGFGADVTGVDLSKPLPPATLAAIQDALARHAVLSFPDQPLSLDELEAFTLQIGPFGEDPFIKPMPGRPNVLELRREPDEKAPNFGGGWHSDMSFLETPAIGSILYGVEIPEFGGDTLFASQAAAYDALSPGLKATLEGLSAVHSASREYSAKGASAQKRGSMQVAEADGYVGEYVHPMVLVHPETGRKALYVNPAFTLRIDGWKTSESKALLDYLFNHCRYEGFTCRFTWQQGSVAFWDNRSVWHFALNDYPGQRRHMRRVTVDPWPQARAVAAA